MVRVLKIGGSILTDKRGERGVIQEEIERVAREVATRPQIWCWYIGARLLWAYPCHGNRLPQKVQPEGLRVTHESVVRLIHLLPWTALAGAGETIPFLSTPCPASPSPGEG